MSKLLDQLSEVYEPFAAIVAYKSDSVNDSKAFYLEQHNISKNGTLGPGKPLMEKTLVDIVNVIRSSNKQIDTSLYGTVPSNVLYCDTRIGSEKLVWWTKPQEQMLYFVESLGIPNGKMTVPGLVFKVNGKTLSVYAFKGAKPKAKLCYAPFMNVSSESVCLGNAKIKFPDERTFENVIEYWEKMFWQSEFSHILGSNPCIGNLATITKKCIAEGIPFPQSALKPLEKTTLKDLMR